MRSPLLALSLAALGMVFSAPQGAEAAAACTRPGLPAGCVGAPARAAGAPGVPAAGAPGYGAAGRGANVNGGANRAGAR
jgi:hypothetical protein